jgi:hypothetical protein
MNKWVVYRDEERGAIQDKLWMTNGLENALFKPDSELHESTYEVEAYRISCALGMACAKTEEVDIEGVHGTLSYNFKEDGYKYKAVSELYQSASGKFLANSKDSDGISLQRFNNLSLSDIQNNPLLKAIENDTVNMLFLDCLISNADRHGNNWELKFSQDGKELLGVAPLFDHGMSQDLAPYDYCMLKIDSKEMEVTHMSMFQYLAQKYPGQIGQLLDKCQSIELNDFCSKRFTEMQEIYAEQTKNKEATLSR